MRGSPVSFTSRPRAAFGALLVLTALAGPAHAQRLPPLQEAANLLREAEAMWTSGNLDAIAARLRLALHLAEPLLESDDPRLGVILAMLCRNGFNRGDFAEAEPACRRAVGISERIAPGQMETARLLGDLGAVLRMQQRYAEAELFVRASLRQRAAISGEQTAWFAAGLDNLARVLIGQQRLVEALVIAEAATAIRAETLGREHALTEASRALAQEVSDSLAVSRRI